MDGRAGAHSRSHALSLASPVTEELNIRRSSVACGSWKSCRNSPADAETDFGRGGRPGRRHLFGGQRRGGRAEPRQPSGRALPLLLPGLPARDLGGRRVPLGDGRAHAGLGLTPTTRGRPAPWRSARAAAITRDGLHCPRAFRVAGLRRGGPSGPKAGAGAPSTGRAPLGRGGRAHAGGRPARAPFGSGRKRSGLPSCGAARLTSSSAGGGRSGISRGPCPARREPPRSSLGRHRVEQELHGLTTGGGRLPEGGGAGRATEQAGAAPRSHGAGPSPPRPAAPRPLGYTQRRSTFRLLRVSSSWAPGSSQYWPSSRSGRSVEQRNRRECGWAGR